jgi:phosphomevalonate kinase
MVSQGYVNELVKKVLRKQRKSLDTTIRANILKKNKHHTSINRLYKLAKTLDEVLAEKIKAIIKKYGYFIN